MLVPGTRLGAYEITAHLGAGGMGEVYKARDTRLDRTVAVKILSSEIAASPDLRERFEREARTVASLNHPHICTLHDIGRQDATDFLVMEYLDGETLEQRLKKGTLPLDQALQIGIQIADALAAAHRAGIVHRDLKPGNIMLTKSGAKLLDFGLAKTAAPAVAGSLSMLPTTPPNLTAQGTILGTFQYMAPEQLEGQDADARTDIFAFGSVLYELVTGKKAFDGKSQANLIAAILEREPPAMSTLQPLTPPLLDHVVRRCLSKEPDERWQNAGDVMRELQWISATGASIAKPVSRRRERVAWILAAISAAVALSLVTPAILYFRRAAPDSSPLFLEVATPATDDPSSFAISPDGERLTYSARDDKGVNRLWLRSLADGTARPLTDTARATYPFWAPNSREIGFFSDRKLKRIDITGGGSEIVADAPAGRGGTWNAEDVILFAPDTGRGLFRVSARGGPATAVTKAIGGQTSGPRWPQFLPDGRRFVFLLSPAPEQTRGVYLASLDGGEPQRILGAESTAIYVAPGFLLLARQDVLVALPFDVDRGIVGSNAVRLADGVGTDKGLARSALSASTTGRFAFRAGAAAQRRQLVWVDRRGRAQGTVGPPDDAGVPGNPELSPDERRVGVHGSVQVNNVDVWFLDVDRGVNSRFTSDPFNEISPLWSPDGQRVVFGSTRNGVYDLFEKHSNNTTEAAPLLVTPEEKRPVSWSADGHYILYVTTLAQTGRDLWALPMTGDRKPFPVVQTTFDEDEGQIAPNGKWVAYTSTQSGRLEVYVQSFPRSGGGLRISTAGGGQVRWAPNNQELYYVDPNNRLMAVQLSPSLDGQQLTAGAPEPLFETHLAYGANITGSKPQYAVARDGRFLLNVIVDEARPLPITIVLNGTTALLR
jgi:serine/threonine protein kinase